MSTVTLASRSRNIAKGCASLRQSFVVPSIYAIHCCDYHFLPHIFVLSINVFFCNDVYIVGVRLVEVALARYSSRFRRIEALC